MIVHEVLCFSIVGMPCIFQGFASIRVHHTRTKICMRVLLYCRLTMQISGVWIDCGVLMPCMADLLCGALVMCLVASLFINVFPNG